MKNRYSVAYKANILSILKMLPQILLSVGGILSIATALAQDIECGASSGATLASLIKNDANVKLISDLVEPWESDEVIRVATVEGYIHKSGSLSDPWVVRTDFPYGMRTLLTRLKRLDIAPATVNGEPVAVYASLSVVATKVGDIVSTAVL